MVERGRETLYARMNILSEHHSADRREVRSSAHAFIVKDDE